MIWSLADDCNDQTGLVWSLLHFVLQNAIVLRRFPLHASCALYYKMFHFSTQRAWQGGSLRTPVASPGCGAFGIEPSCTIKCIAVLSHSPLGRIVSSFAIRILKMNSRKTLFKEINLQPLSIPSSSRIQS